MVKAIHAEVNAQLELMNSILITSNHGALLQSIMGFQPMMDCQSEYTAAIKKYLAPYSGHEIYTLVDDMTVKGFYLGRPVELMCSLAELPGLERKFAVSTLCSQLCGGEEGIDRLLRVLRDFVVTVDYASFWTKVTSSYAVSLEAVHRHLKRFPFVSVMEEFYGREQRSYRYSITCLSKGSFGISFRNNNQLDMINVMYMSDPCGTAEQNEMHRGALSVNVTFHEFAHPIINPLTEKHNSEILKYRQAYERLQPYKLPGFQSGYGDWSECVNEHLVRAIAIHLAQKIGQEEYALKHLQHDMNAGYRYLPALLNKLEEYERSRFVYKTMEDFYPEWVEVFAGEVG